MSVSAAHITAQHNNAWFTCCFVWFSICSMIKSLQECGEVDTSIRANTSRLSQQHNRTYNLVAIWHAAFDDNFMLAVPCCYFAPSTHVAGVASCLSGSMAVVAWPLDLLEEATTNLAPLHLECKRDDKHMSNGIVLLQRCSPCCATYNVTRATTMWALLHC